MNLKTVLQGVYAALIGLAGVGLTAIQQAASDGAVITGDLTLDKLAVFVVLTLVARGAGYLVGKFPQQEE